MSETILKPKKHKRIDLSAFAFSQYCTLNPEFLQDLPSLLRFSSNLKCEGYTSTSLGKAENAIQQPWVNFDSENLRNTIVLDIDTDYQETLERWLEIPENLRPHLIIDPWSGRSCAVFRLKIPVDYKNYNKTGEKSKAILYVEHIHEILASYFKADRIPKGVVHKNPFGKLNELQNSLIRRTDKPVYPDLYQAYKESGSDLIWITKSGADFHDLRELAGFYKPHLEFDFEEEFRLARIKNRKSKSTEIDKILEAYATGRNQGIFTELRFWAYENHPACLANEAINQQAQSFNLKLAEPLSESELQVIAKSVHGFMKNRYRESSRPNKGVMGLSGADLELAEKQAMAADRTNIMRREKALSSLLKAQQSWPAGKKLTQAGLAKQAGLSRRFVVSVWPSIIP